MTPNDMGYLPSISLIPAAAVTATANGTAVDIKDFIGNLQVLLDAGAGTGTTPTLDIKLQDSPDNVTFTDIAGKSFTQVTAAASRQQMVLNTDACARYVRAVATLGGSTPSFPVSVQAVGVKQVFP